MASTPDSATTPTGPVLFAYDGSELSALAIEEAGRQLAMGRDALVLCVWQPADVGFVPAGNLHFDANQATQVHLAAKETAAQGSALAERAGFRSKSVVVEVAPTWRGIVETAADRKASLIVIGSHRHSGLAGHLVGNVAAAVIAHSTLPVLIVHQQS